MTRLPFVQRIILDDQRSFMADLLWLVVPVAVAIAVRVLFGPWVMGAPYLTFFPAVLVVSLFLGWRWGLAATVISAIAANIFAGAPSLAWALSDWDITSALAFFASALLLVITASTLRRTFRELDASARRAVVLNTELQHRVKNNMTIIQGFARQTAKSAEKVGEFYQIFAARLAALAEAHSVLSSGNWEECRLPDLPMAAMHPFDDHGGLTVSGAACVIPASSCVPLVLALHELGTNAMKYGALSVPSGRVALTWALADGCVLIRWQEAGGPRVRAPSRQGLGSRLLSKQTGLDAVSLDYRREGVVCEIRIEGARPAQ